MPKKNSIRTSSKVAAVAAKTLARPSGNKATKTLAGSALSNRKKTSSK